MIYQKSSAFLELQAETWEPVIRGVFGLLLRRKQKRHLSQYIGVFLRKESPTFSQTSSFFCTKNILTYFSSWHIIQKPKDSLKKSDAF